MKEPEIIESLAKHCLMILRLMYQRTPTESQVSTLAAAMHVMRAAQEQAAKPKRGMK